MTRHGGVDDFLDAVERGEPYYLACEEGHASLPPRRTCPECGSTALDERSFPDEGRVEARTVVRVPTPAFADDAPYVLGVASFGPVRVTGRVAGVDPDDAANVTGAPVALGLGESATTGDRLLRLELR